MCGSEAKLQLEFDDTARETIQRPAELSCVGDIGWRTRRCQRFKIQYVEGIKEVAVELELSVLAKPARIRKEKVLTEREIELCKSRPFKNIAAAAPRAFGTSGDGVCGVRKTGRGIREHTVLPILL